MLSVKVEFEAELLDADAVMPHVVHGITNYLAKTGDLVLDKEVVWTVCSGGEHDADYVVPRVCRSDVLGYIVVPDEMDVVIE